MGGRKREMEGEEKERGNGRREKKERGRYTFMCTVLHATSMVHICSHASWNLALGLGKHIIFYCSNTIETLFSWKYSAVQVGLIY